MNNVLTGYFGKVYSEPEFLDLTFQLLNELGFNADNSIACMGVCRDEISQSLVEIANRKWGYIFNLSSLAGMFLAGKTGLLAAMHHSPDTEGKERYVFYALPHIAIDDNGRVGVCKREGRKGESTACGALNAFQKEMAGGRINPTLDFSDVELSLLKTRLLREIPYGEVPDLLELTKITQKAIKADLELALEAIVDSGISSYAVISGIQVHGSDANYIWPESCYAIVNGARYQLEL